MTTFSVELSLKVAQYISTTLAQNFNTRESVSILKMIEVIFVFCVGCIFHILIQNIHCHLTGCRAGSRLSWILAEQESG